MLKKSEFLILLLLILITSFLETFTIGVFLPFVTLILGGKTNINSLIFLKIII